MIDLQLLEQLVTFYHSGTLCEASKKLHISQSTLTRGMQKLEAEFGVPLFSRTKNSISLTEAGQLAVADAELILRQYENMKKRIQDFDRRNRTISIGACAPVPLPVLIRRMTSHHADAAITSELKNIPQLLRGLEDDTYQLIILPYRPKDPGLICSRLCDEALFFYLDRQHPFAGRKSLSVKEMNGENILLFQDIGFWHDLVLEKMPDSRFLMQSERYSFQELIANSTLSVFTSDAYPDETPDSRRIRVPISDPEFHVTYYLACKKEHGRKFRGIFLRQATPGASSFPQH